MLQKDYYKILGLDRKASQQDIKKAFRRLAREYHPDVNRDKAENNDRFKDIAEAYEVLGDPERRRQFDQGHIDQTWFTATSFENIRDIFERTAVRQSQRQQDKTKGKFNFGDFITNISSTIADSVGSVTKESTQKAKKPPPSLDIEQMLQISLEEAWNGTRKPVTVRHEKPCVLCGGSGQVSGQTCRNCQGKGVSRQEKRLDVKVPAGVRKGSKIRVPNEGIKHGQHHGHLYLVVELMDHPFFDADENGDLHCEMPITLTEAVLGTEFQLPTLGGRVKMKIPPGSQPGQVFRLRGKGMKHPKDGDHGDLYVEIQVVVPRHLSNREQDLYRELARSGEDLRRNLGF